MRDTVLYRQILGLMSVGSVRSSRLTRFGSIPMKSKELTIQPLHNQT